MRSCAGFLFVAAIFILGAVSAAAAPVPCAGGMAGPYPCDKVDMQAFMTLQSIGGGSGNDVWGWTDPLTGREYAILGLTNATSFVDITDPVNPVYLGRLLAPPAGACIPSAGQAAPPAFAPDHEECPSDLPVPEGGFAPDHVCSGDSTWRDLEVYADHAFIGSEQGGHGLVVFDLRRLRAFSPPYGRRPPVTFTQTARYCGIGSSHTISVNTTAGFVYANGSSSACGSGRPHIVNVQTPGMPVFAGCDNTTGTYTHDSQCLVYQGPDVAHQGKSICINSNGSGTNANNRLVISDVTNPAAAALLSSTFYAGAGYTHQGWITADHRYFLLDDELDESDFGHNTRTYIWDFTDLDAPVMMGYHEHATPAIDHQQFIHGNFAYQSNYRAGLRILETENIAAGQLGEVGFFDVYPANDLRGFNGTWANYPFFQSGTVVVTTIENSGFGGFFVLRPRFADLEVTVTDSPDPVVLGQDVTYTFTVQNQGPTYSANTTLTDTLPANLSFVSATASQGTCSGTTTVTCNLGTIQNGAAATVTLVARPTALGTISNSGVASSDETDTRLADNTGTAQTTVNSSVQVPLGRR
jgi:choice-of-anchor B domain-containing protein